MHCEKVRQDCRPPNRVSKPSKTGCSERGRACSNGQVSAGDAEAVYGQEGVFRQT